MLKEQNKKTNILKNSLNWFFLTFLLLSINRSNDFNSDEGVILGGAWRMINGEKLYLDFFEFVGPMNFWLLASWWKIFPQNYYSAWTMSIIILLFSTWGIKKLSEAHGLKNNWTPAYLFVLSTIFWPIINHNSFVICFIVWGSYFIIRQKNKKDFILSGFFAGLSIITLQHRGVALFFYQVFNIIKNKVFLKQKTTWLYLLSLTLVITLVVIKIPPNILWDSLIVFPSQNYLAVNKISKITWLIFLIIFISLFFVIKKRKCGEKTNELFFLQLILSISILSRPDISHIMQIAWPSFIIIGLIVNNIVFKNNFIKRIFYFLLYYFCFCLIVFYYIKLGLSFDRPDLKKEVDRFCPEEIIYAGPFMPGLYFELKKKNPTPYGILVTNHQTEEQIKEAAEKIEQNPPLCAIINYQMVNKFKHNINNPVDIFILNNYETIKTLNNHLFIMRKYNQD